MCTWLYTYYQKVRKLWKWRASNSQKYSPRLVTRPLSGVRQIYGFDEQEKVWLRNNWKDQVRREDLVNLNAVESNTIHIYAAKYTPNTIHVHTVLKQYFVSMYLKSITLPLLQFKVSHPKKSICWRLLFETGICKAHIYESNISQSTSSSKEALQTINSNAQTSHCERSLGEPDYTLLAGFSILHSQPIPMLYKTK